MDSFEKLSDEQVEQLIVSLERLNLNDSIHALCFMKQIAGWKKKVPEVNFSVYSPDGNFDDVTFFLVFIIEGGVFCTYYSSTETGCIILRNALIKSRLVGKDTYCILTSLTDRVHDIVGLEWRTRVAGPFQRSQNCHNYIITQEDARALSVKCPEEVYIRDLTLADAEFINSKWPHSNPVSIKLMKGIINFSTCLGLCSKENGELLSWAMKWYYGGIGVVQTVEHAKNKGYAKAVVAELIKRMVEESWPIHLNIIDGNDQSISLFSKMGFKKINKCFWYYYNVFTSDEENHKES